MRETIASITDAETPLGALFARLADDGKAVVRAEVGVYKQVALSRWAASRTAIGLLAGALLVVQAAITVLLVALGMALAPLIGAVGGMAVAALAGLALAYLFVRIALAKLAGAAAAP